MLYRSRGMGLGILAFLSILLIGCAAPVRSSASLSISSHAKPGIEKTPTATSVRVAKPLAVELPTETATATNTPVPTSTPTNTPPPTSTPVPTLQFTHETGGYSPTKGWRASTPEDQGMSSETLLGMLNAVQNESLALHNVTIVRHGYIVLDAYWYPYQAGIKHELESCTKSFVSALTGIAISKGILPGVDSRVTDLLPAQLPADADPRTSSITLKHLLTMSSGLDWPLGGDSDATTAMEASSDWPSYVLNRAQADDPGSAWVYNNGTAHLLSAILRRASGMNTLDFARTNLFGPMGITDVAWSNDPQGTSVGFGGLRMAPRDMAKLGLLYLHGGVWDGKQLLPIDWVSASLSRQMTGDWFDGYGYLWYMVGPDAFGAYGSGDQFILVVPSKDLVAVFTGGMDKDSQGMLPPVRFLYQAILPAVRSDGPRPADKDSFARLSGAVRAAAAPPASAQPSSQPGTAAAVSGQTYPLETNDFGLTSISLTLTGGAEARAVLGFGQPMALNVGLDGVYRMTGGIPALNGLAIDGPVATRGGWKDGSTFAFDIQPLGWTDRYHIETNFHNNTADVTISSAIWGYTIQAKGKQQ